MMKDDPVIAEIREVRHRISAEQDHDPRKVVDYYIEMQKQYRERLVESAADEEKHRQPVSYTGAQVVSCEDPALKPGDRCPQWPGHLYDTKRPTIFIHLTGQPIVAATRYDHQVLRCSSCQTRFTAPLPEGVPPQKYDSPADVAIAVAKYAGGISSYWLARLQESCGVPLSESVQFECCDGC